MICQVCHLWFPDRAHSVIIDTLIGLNGANLVREFSVSNFDRRHNNPRVFAQTISIDAWRTQFDGERAEADLHIDVVFSEGRVGGKTEDDYAPVRFRLSLKRAEVHVIRDSIGVIDIPPSSIARTPQPSGTETVVEKKKKHLSGKGKAAASSSALSASGEVEGCASTEMTKCLETSSDATLMKVSHRKTERGYAFVIAPKSSDRLDGVPWDADAPRMKLRDTKADRKRGEPPEILIEIHCLREDLIIEDVQFTDDDVQLWERLTRNRQVVVEQYIKDELLRMGLPCGNLSDPFARLVMADVAPYGDS